MSSVIKTGRLAQFFRTHRRKYYRIAAVLWRSESDSPKPALRSNTRLDAALGLQHDLAGMLFSEKISLGRRYFAQRIGS